MSNCSSEFPKSEVLFDELKHDTAAMVLLPICGVVALASIAVFIEEVHFIITHFKSKTNKYRFIHLTALYPVVCFCCMLGLLVPTSTMLVEFINSVYLSFCIMTFVNMIVAYFGRPEDVLAEFAGEKMSFRTPPCCCCCICLNDITFNKTSFRFVRIMTLQVAVIRPLVLYIAAVLWSDGRYEPGETMSFDRASVYIQIISGVSTLLAVWALIVTYRNTVNKLRHHRLSIKFASLQIAIVVNNFQQLIFSILARYDIPSCIGSRGPVVRGYRFNYFLLIFEMFLLGILARFAYRRQEEYIETSENKQVEMPRSGDEIGKR